jgi:hypothetical protein
LALWQQFLWQRSCGGLGRRRGGEGGREEEGRRRKRRRLHPGGVQVLNPLPKFGGMTPRGHKSTAGCLEVGEGLVEDKTPSEEGLGRNWLWCFSFRNKYQLKKVF